LDESYKASKVFLTSQIPVLGKKVTSVTLPNVRNAH